MTIERGIKITTLMLILYVAALVLILFWSSHQVGRGISAIETASAINRSAFMLRVLMNDYLEQGSKRILTQWEEQNARLGQILSDEKLSESLDAALLEEVRKSFQAVKLLYPRLTEMRSSTETGDRIQDAKAMRMLTDLMSLQLEQLVHAGNDLSRATQALTVKKRDFVGGLVVALGIFSVILIIVNIHLIRKSVVVPLQLLSRRAEGVGAGSFDLVPETKSDDEVGKLTQAFNAMIRGLRRQTEELKNAQKELELRVEERTKDLRLSNAELERSNADLQQFAHVASHDLQEPLRNVAGCLQLLEKKYRNQLGADADDYIHHAVESAMRMKALILDLLAYSRVATRGKTPERIDCKQVLDLAVANLRSSISDAKAVITHDPLPTVLGDASQLSQVFQNLIQNAIKFRKDEPPKVHVSAVKNEHEWVFSVRDNGIGINSQHLERIFVIFQRLNKRDQYDGTGIGLAIVKKVVERQGGRVWAESEPGLGTTFYFTIPEEERT